MWASMFSRTTASPFTKNLFSTERPIRDAPVDFSSPVADIIAIYLAKNSPKEHITVPKTAETIFATSEHPILDGPSLIPRIFNRIPLEQYPTFANTIFPKYLHFMDSLSAGINTPINFAGSANGDLVGADDFSDLIVIKDPHVYVADDALQWWRSHMEEWTEEEGLDELEVDKRALLERIENGTWSYAMHFRVWGNEREQKIVLISAAEDVCEVFMDMY
ncbi:hypothetical protein HK097_008246 [Rhizophlyctis rosea]|uniref:Uncharacterized protein n=1 Tax=Rhizophlyctis rosea TaxID=64517 RepID=A0AAD5SC27_9FUNG|nr:hypothetical protein HK097_008246 [Rhizophlyctis rosea]